MPELDWLDVVKFINWGTCPPNSPHAELLLQVLQVFNRQWSISIIHIFKEFNCVADYLAKCVVYDHTSLSIRSVFS